MVTLVPSTRRRTTAIVGTTVIPDEVLQDDTNANILDEDNGTLVVEFGEVIQNQNPYRRATPLTAGTKRTTTL